MSGIKYIGRTTDFHGLTLWEIVANLRNFGKGRLVVRNMFQRYSEPCYMRILNVEAVPEEENQIRKVRVTVERTWRGITYPKPVVIFSSSYKPDYLLVPKDEEEKYLNNTKKISEKVLPTKLDLPPLLREFVADETGEQQPMMKVHFKKTLNKFVRLAEANEQPTLDISISNRPAPEARNLYKGVF